MKVPVHHPPSGENRRGEISISEQKFYPILKTTVKNKMHLPIKTKI
jgi:hypothetical protein